MPFLHLKRKVFRNQIQRGHHFQDDFFIIRAFIGSGPMVLIFGLFTYPKGGLSAQKLLNNGVREMNCLAVIRAGIAIVLSLQKTLFNLL